jgi:hypothetical protein
LAITDFIIESRIGTPVGAEGSLLAADFTEVSERCWRFNFNFNAIASANWLS